MATSGVYTFNSTRDTIIKRALQIVGDEGENATPNSFAVADAAIALNAIMKQLQAKGMPLWTVKEYTLTPVAGTRQYTVGVGGAVNDAPALKVTQAFLRDNTNTAAPQDSPLLILTRNDYELLGDKFSQGRPSQFWYDPPGNLGSGNMLGTMTLYNVPDATTAANCQVIFIGTRAIQDVAASTDQLDFPSYWENAVTWCLANELAYSSHVPLSERSMITKMMMFHLEEALSFGTEEGSLFVHPEPQYNYSGLDGFYRRG